MSSRAVLRYRRIWLAIGYALVGVTAWGSVTPHPPGWVFVLTDKVVHGATYALLTFWFGQIYHGARRHWLLVGLFSLLGVLLEVGQAYSSIYRHFDLYDAAAGTTGTLVAWVLLRTPLATSLEAVDGWLARWRA